jgi:hypothetical protein
MLGGQGSRRPGCWSGRKFAKLEGTTMCLSACVWREVRGAAVYVLRHVVTAGRQVLEVERLSNA